MLPQSPVNVVELSVNLDDQTGQIIGDAIDTLLAQGALDAWTTPIGMKKNRPGTMLSLLASPQDQDRLALLLLELTGSFGVRMRPVSRLVLDRKHITVDSPLGQFRLKVGSLHGRIIVARPEMQDVKTLALKAGIPLRLAIEQANAAAQKTIESQK
jgi:pyridinium-3,5-bisthiocarboxylic acid mononucleotide nickel chelatase